MKRLTLFSVAAATLAAAALTAGCGGSSGENASGGSSGNNSRTYGNGGNSNSGSAESAAGATIAVADSSPGQILVNGQRRAVYLFEKDSGTASTCYAVCANVWPPVTTTGNPKAGQGAVAAKLGTTKRSDGALQVTYDGHPLYTYAGDSSPAQTNGEGLDQFGAEWYVLSPTGQAVENGGSVG